MEISAPQKLKDTEGPQLLAILEVLYFVAKADGFFSADELRAFLRTAMKLSEGKFSSVHLSQLVDSWAKREVVDIDERLGEIATVLSDDETRQITLDLATQMAGADQKTEASEKAMLGRIAQAFSLS